MEQLGTSNAVTTFTASDFSRTFPTNSQGSDHGWGSNHIVMGGAVRGARTYGRIPEFTINGPDDTGTGRWIPEFIGGSVCRDLRGVVRRRQSHYGRRVP
jgi:uncharacterized protein (DUF1501 family)